MPARSTSRPTGGPTTHEGEAEEQRGQREHARAILARRVFLHDAGEDRGLQAADRHEAEVEAESPGRRARGEAGVAERHEEAAAEERGAHAEGADHPGARQRHQGEPGVRCRPEGAEPCRRHAAGLRGGWISQITTKVDSPSATLRAIAACSRRCCHRVKRTTCSARARCERCAAGAVSPRDLAQRADDSRREQGDGDLEPEGQARRERVEPAADGRAARLADLSGGAHPAVPARVLACRPSASSDTHSRARSAPEMKALPPPSTTSATVTPAKLVAAV